MLDIQSHNVITEYFEKRLSLLIHMCLLTMKRLRQLANEYMSLCYLNTWFNIPTFCKEKN